MKSQESPEGGVRYAGLFTPYRKVLSAGDGRFGL
jgi:hypothetical protein